MAIIRLAEDHCEPLNTSELPYRLLECLIHPGPLAKPNGEVLNTLDFMAWNGGHQVSDLSGFIAVEEDSASRLVEICRTTEGQDEVLQGLCAALLVDAENDRSQ